MTEVRLANLLTPERILPMLNAAGAPAAIQALARVAAQQVGLSEEPVLDAIRETERVAAFGVGRGVAVPHALLGGMSEPTGAFAHLRHVADFSREARRHETAASFAVEPL